MHYAAPLMPRAKARPLLVFALVIAASGLTGCGVAAAPSAPPGWTQTAMGTVAVYRPAADSERVELRYYPPSAAVGDYGSWFAKRVQTGPVGIDVREPGTPSKTPSNGYLAISKGLRADGRTRLIIGSIGCQAKDGAAYYAELLSPPDVTILTKYVNDAAAILGRACFGSSGAAPLQTAAPGTATPVAAPGRSVPTSRGAIKATDIETVLNSWQQNWVFSGTMHQEMTDNTYLLLKDGSYLREMPKVPFEQFDAAANKIQNPKNWGRWRKQGGKYALAWAGSSTFEVPPNQSARVPARPGETLQGYFQASSSGEYAGVSMWATSSVKLTRDGRFHIGNSRGSAMSYPYGDGGMTMATSGNGEGSVSSTGRGYVVGSGSKPKAGGSDYDGSYRLNGYMMELMFDSGRVKRQLFYTNDTRSVVWFDGAELLNLK
jgi:hypothetical protein